MYSSFPLSFVDNVLQKMWACELVSSSTYLLNIYLSIYLSKNYKLPHESCVFSFLFFQPNSIVNLDSSLLPDRRFLLEEFQRNSRFAALWTEAVVLCHANSCAPKRGVYKGRLVRVKWAAVNEHVNTFFQEGPVWNCEFIGPNVADLS